VAGPRAAPFRSRIVLDYPGTRGITVTYDVQRLSDCQEIRDLNAQYNYFADTGDAAGYAELFVPDGEFDVVGHTVYRGRDQLTDLISRADAAGELKPVHITADPQVEISGDTARQRCRLITCVRSADGSRNDLVNTGWFHDELRRTPDGWRFVRRRAEVDLSIAATFAKLGIGALLSA
jgi:ketosteroid isomerase-like protein